MWKEKRLRDESIKKPESNLYRRKTNVPMKAIIRRTLLEEYYYKINQRKMRKKT